jgi:hypothetical protein
MSLFRRKSRIPERNSFSIAVTSPKYKEFSTQYLVDGELIRPDIQNRIMKIPGVKSLSVAYDQENRRWGFDILTIRASDARAVALDPYVASLPCRVIPSNIY